jgi:amino acid transporter
VSVVPRRDSAHSQIALAGLIGVGFKIFAKTKFQRAKDIDLVSDVEFFQLLDEHYKHEKEIQPESQVQRIVNKVF